MRSPSRRLRAESLEVRSTPAALNIMATFRDNPAPNQIGLFSPSGELLWAVDNPDTINGDENGPHDLDLTADGRWVVFNGHFDATLNIYDPETGSWDQASLPGWSSVGNDSYGGLTTVGNYVYVPDMNTNNDAPIGIIRFNLDDLSGERFAVTREYTDLNIGLDGLLYALRGDYGPIDVFNPMTMGLLRTVSPADGGTYRGVTADAAGNLYVIDWNEDVWKLAPNGQVLASYHIDGPEGEFFGDTFDIDISNDGQYLVIGSRFGWVTQMTSSFTNVTYFYASEDRVVHVSFAEPPLDISPVRIVQTDASTDVEEGVAADTYTIVLSSQPTQDVTVTLSANSQVSLSTAEVTFTPLNWNTPQTITVAAVDDSIDENLHPASISHSVSSADPNFDGTDYDVVIVKIADNDTAGIEMANFEALSVREGSTTDEYQITLQSQPTDDVVVDLQAGPEITLSASQLIFTAADWNVPQTITVSSPIDGLLEGTEFSNIAHTVSSEDPNYQSQTLPTLDVTIDDGDAGVMFDGAPQTAEGGAAGVYSMKLSKEPAADVTLAFFGGDQLVAAPNAVVFTSANWNVPQFVTISAIDDFVAEGDHAGTISYSVSSLDSQYDQLQIPNLNVPIADNDVAGIEMTGFEELHVQEGFSTDQYQIALQSQPTADVVIDLQPGPEIFLSTSQLIFTAANWNTPQTITVSSMIDGLLEGTEISNIAHAVSSADPMYQSQTLPTLDVTIDDGEPGVEIAGAPQTAEGGAADSYSMKLLTPPTSDVTIAFFGGDQLIAAPNPVVFTAANWNVPQFVSISAVNDFIAEGNHAGTISYSVSSLDTQYDQLQIPNLNVPISDNDTAGVIVTPTSALIVNESGSTATFQISLATIPTQPVTIHLQSSNPQQGTVSPSAVTFLPGDGLAPKIVTVSGVDDSINDGEAIFQILTSLTSSSDGFYNNLTVDDLEFTVTNDDYNQLINPGEYMEEDGDIVRLKLTGPGAVAVSIDDPDQNAIGSIKSIFIAGGDPVKTKLTLTIKKAKTGDGLTSIGSISGSMIASITAKAIDLAGEGVRVDGWLGSLTVRNILNGADIIAGGAPSQFTRITANDIQDGTSITLGSNLKMFKAARFGNSEIRVPSLGVLNIVGNMKQAIPADFAGDVFISGQGVAAGKATLTRFNVKGTVDDSTIEVAGNVGSVQAGRFVNSRLFVGYTPNLSADPFAGGTFLPGVTLGSFKTLGLKNSTAASFEDSFVAADKLGTATLKSVLADNGGGKYGFLVNETIKKAKVTAAGFQYSPTTPNVGDFEIRVV